MGTPGRELEQSRGNLCFRFLVPKRLLAFPAFGLVEAIIGMCEYIPKILPDSQKEPEPEKVINGC